ncbi:MAG: low molecular weight protein-tyrosine-phosphatase [Nocardioidaceae bacterium]
MTSATSRDPSRADFDSPGLPAPQQPDSHYRIVMVCLGNICRSPTAEVVLTAKLAAAAPADRVVVRSAGAGDWHLGQQMHPTSASTLEEQGYDSTVHRAAQFIGSWFGEFDLVLAMDTSNLASLGALAVDDSARQRVLMFRAFDPLAGDDMEVPDPWHGDQGGFDAVLAIVERVTDQLVERLRALLG